MRWSLLLLAACGASVPPPAPSPAPKSSEVPISDPAEYTIDRISRDAGKRIFERTGIGDPYRTGMPYPMFLALLRAYPDVLAHDGGELAARFGFVARAADPRSDDPDVRAGLPLGMHLTTDPITGVPFVVTSCAVCHAERLHWRGGEATVIGLGNKRVRIHAYDAAFAEVTRRPDFSAAHLARLATEEAEAHHVVWPEAYRDAIAAATIAALRTRADERRALHARTAEANPPGRVAVIESFALFLHADMVPDVGWAKIPDVIGYAHRTTLSWDGSQEGPLDLLAVEADIAAGVRVAWLERHPFQGASLGAYLRHPAARPAFPGPIDRALAARGKQLFEDNCAHCHGTYASDGRVLDYDEQVVPIEDLGVDPARMMAATASFERAANDPALTRGYTRFRRATGYVPPVLTNVWARAPYGHAGQWPSLAVLATPPAERPTRVAIDPGGLYDLATVGVPIVTTGGYVQDATRPGFGVGGHPFLADLGRDAPAVIEYLKTL
jgi:mono/diheme cytochrome c family protein